MGDCVRELCLLSVLFGVLLDLTPEGSVKKIETVVCSAALICVLLSSADGLNVRRYFSETARYREMSAALAERSEESRDRLNRLVIQSECEAYIRDKAEALGADGISAKVTARWEDGIWMPESVILAGTPDGEIRARLSELIRTELGIAEAKQEWTE